MAGLVQETGGEKVADATATRRAANEESLHLTVVTLQKPQGDATDHEVAIPGKK